MICSLDPDEDPLCMLLLVDFYALRSEQYDLLVRMYMEWESHRNLSQLPNFAFSVPLAMYHLSVHSSTQQHNADDMVSLFLSVLTMPCLSNHGLCSLSIHITVCAVMLTVIPVTTKVMEVPNLDPFRGFVLREHFSTKTKFHLIRPNRECSPHG